MACAVLLLSLAVTCCAAPLGEPWLAAGCWRPPLGWLERLEGRKGRTGRRGRPPLLPLQPSRSRRSALERCRPAALCLHAGEFTAGTVVPFGGPSDGKDPHVASGGLLEGSCGEPARAA